MTILAALAFLAWHPPLDHRPAEWVCAAVVQTLELKAPGAGRECPVAMKAPE